VLARATKTTTIFTHLLFGALFERGKRRVFLFGERMITTDWIGLNGQRRRVR
jgi:hypothetical protein